MKKRLRLTPILIAIMMLFAMMPMMAQGAYAKGDSPDIVKSGDLGNFAKDAPITTVRLDPEQFKPTFSEQVPTIPKNPTLTYQMNSSYSHNKFEWNDSAAVVINDFETESTADDEDGSMLPGSFTLTYKDAAIMPDGTTRDFRATYTPEILMKKDTLSYKDSFTIAAVESGKPGITIQPLSQTGAHFGLRVRVSCQIVGNDTDNLAGETFLLVSDEINNVRPSALAHFSQIVFAQYNNNYSEAIQFESGVDSESDIYLTGDPALSIKDINYNDLSDLTGVNGYDVRFVATGSAKHSPSHIATVASASGIQARIWSSAGINTEPLVLYYLNLGDYTKEHTSSSGEGGKIELWTDGQTHKRDSEAGKLAGGTTTAPYTYAVPYGKEVTYRMTPKKGYMIDKLYVNGDEVDLENDPYVSKYRNSAGDIDYYEYHFGSGTVNNDQEIGVTWKKSTATTDPIKVVGMPTAKMIAKGKTGFTISWNKIQGAAGYDIFFSRCGHKTTCKKAKTIKGNKTFKWTKSGLKKGTPYKAYVRAYIYKNGKKTYVRTSPMMHAYTGNGSNKSTNAKSVTLKNVKKGKLSLKKGKTFKIKAKVNKVNKNKRLMPNNHAPKLRYLSSNNKVAKVSKSGKITAKSKGTCNIVVFAHNGVSKSIKVTVP